VPLTVHKVVVLLLLTEQTAESELSKIVSQTGRTLLPVWDTILLNFAQFNFAENSTVEIFSLLNTIQKA
jgi:hypothetical protein